MSQKQRLTAADHSDLCRLILERATGWTLAEIGHELGINTDSATCRVWKIEKIHPGIRKEVGRSRCGHRTIYALTARGLVVMGAIAAGNPVPSGNARRRVKLSAHETAYLALRATFDLPVPVDPYASTVSHAVTMSR